MQAADSDGSPKFGRADRCSMRCRADQSEGRDELLRHQRCSSHWADLESYEDILRNARAARSSMDRRSLPQCPELPSGDELARTSTSHSFSELRSLARGGADPLYGLAGALWGGDRDRTVREAQHESGQESEIDTQPDASEHSVHDELLRTRASQSFVRQSMHARDRRRAPSDGKKHSKPFQPASRRCLEAAGCELEPRSPCIAVNGDAGPVFLEHQRRKWCATERGPEPAQLIEELVESRLSWRLAAQVPEGMSGAVGESAEDSDADATLSCAETMLDSDAVASTDVVSGASTENESSRKPLADVASQPSSDDLGSLMDRGVSLPAAWTSASWLSSDGIADGAPLQISQPSVPVSSGTSCSSSGAVAVKASISLDSGDDFPTQEVHRALSTGLRLMSAAGRPTTRQLTRSVAGHPDEGLLYIGDVAAEEPIPVAQLLRGGPMAGASSRKQQKACMLIGSQTLSTKSNCQSRACEAAVGSIASSTCKDSSANVQGSVSATPATASIASQSVSLSQSLSTSSMLSCSPSAKQAASLLRQGSAERSLGSADRSFPLSRGPVRPHSVGPPQGTSSAAPGACGSGTAAASTAACPTPCAVAVASLSGPSRVHMRHESSARQAPQLQLGASNCGMPLSPSPSVTNSLTLPPGFSGLPSGRPPGLPATLRRPPPAGPSPPPSVGNSLTGIGSGQPSNAASSSAPSAAAGPPAAGSPTAPPPGMARAARASSPGASSSSSFRAMSPPPKGVTASPHALAASPVRAPCQFRSSFSPLRGSDRSASMSGPPRASASPAPPPSAAAARSQAPLLGYMRRTPSSPSELPARARDFHRQQSRSEMHGEHPPCNASPDGRERDREAARSVDARNRVRSPPARSPPPVRSPTAARSPAPARSPPPMRSLVAARSPAQSPSPATRCPMPEGAHGATPGAKNATHGALLQQQRGQVHHQSEKRGAEGSHPPPTFARGPSASDGYMSPTAPPPSPKAWPSGGKQGREGKERTSYLQSERTLQQQQPPQRTRPTSANRGSSSAAAASPGPTSATASRVGSRGSRPGCGPSQRGFSYSQSALRDNSMSNVAGSPVSGSATSQPPSSPVSKGIASSPASSWVPMPSSPAVSVTAPAAPSAAPRLSLPRGESPGQAPDPSP